MEDKEFIRRIQNGQKEYLNDIAGKYYDDIYYFCRYQTGNAEDAYDLAQETFLRFIRYVEKYRHQNLKGYLLTIAMNLCREYMRENPQMAVEECLQIPAVSEAVANTENGILLSGALKKLTDEQREAVLLHHFYGYKDREIARMTGAASGTVKSRIRQGLEKLNRLLDKSDFYK